MKAKDLLDSMGAIADCYLAEAEPQDAQTASTRRIWVGWSVAVACVCMAMIGVFVWSQQKANRWPIKEILVETTSTTNEDAVVEIPKWEDLGISQQYSQLELGGAIYGGTNKVLSPTQISESLGKYILSGFDELEEQTHTTSGEVFQIAGISSECAVAVKLEGDASLYVYRNSDYRPETLGEFSTDLDLEKNIQFGKVYYEYRKSDGSYATVEFEGLQKADVFRLLLSNAQAKNVENFDQMWLIDVMSISVDLPILGYENVSLGVTQDGYVTTNLLDTGKAFFIGTEQVEAFLEHVKKNCKGYEIVYIEPETSSQEPPADSTASEAVASHSVPGAYASSAVQSHADE